uniref:hypothetical protein n=1 Tax=Escherichia coli TaxID=562 RepID=UPI003395A648
MNIVDKDLNQRRDIRYFTGSSVFHRSKTEAFSSSVIVDGFQKIRVCHVNAKTVAMTSSATYTDPAIRESKTWTFP